MIKQREFEFLKTVLKSRLEIELKGSEIKIPVYQPEESNASELTGFIQKNKLSNPEVITLLLALAPHISPEFFNSIIFSFLPNGGDFPEFGGAKGKNHRGILPTGETILFVLAGSDIEKRSTLMGLFSEDHLFARKGVLYLEEVPVGEPKLSGRLILEHEFVDLFTTGSISKPRLSSNFPAQLIETDLDWSDLILNEKTTTQIAEIETWLKHNQDLMNKWGMKNRIKPGFRILFAGPPGTGKTLTASLLGKYTNRDVYRIDLSLVISKYIGETEKKPFQAVRPGRKQGLDFVLRRSRRFIWQTHRSARCSRQICQSGSFVLAPAHRIACRTGYPCFEHEKQHRLSFYPAVQCHHRI